MQIDKKFYSFMKKQNIKDCSVCVWDNECYIQNAIRAYIRHKHALLKVDFEGFYCSNFADITEIEAEKKKVSDNDTDYLNYYSSE